MSIQAGLQEAFSLNVEDVSGHHKVRAAGISPAMTVRELVRGLVPRMDLPLSDQDGRPMAYHVRLEREGRHLHASEIVGDALEPDDCLILQPHIVAG